MAHPDSFPDRLTPFPATDPVLASSPAWLAAVPLAAVLCDVHGRVIGWNEAAAALCGDELHGGMRGEQLFATHAADGNESNADDTPLAQTLRSGAPSWHTSCVIRTGAGETAAVTASFAPVNGAAGAMVGVLGTFQPRDVSDLEDFFENGSVALHLVANDGTILRANQAELDLLGYRREDYVGRHISEFHVDTDVLHQLQARLRAGGSIDRYPVRLRAADGSIRQARLSSSARPGGDGFINTRTLTQDVTDEQPQDTAARDLERRSHQLLQALPAAVYTTDAHGTITFYNEAAVAFAGRRPQPGDKWCVSWKLYHPDGTLLPHNECPMAVALREQRPIYGEEAIAERPDGSRVAFMAHPTPLFDEAGRMTGALNMLVDITERRYAEQAVRELNDTLEQRVAESERRARGVIDTALDGFVQLDPDGKVLEWNPRAEAMFGWSRAQALHQPLDELIVAPADRDRYRDALLPTLQQRLPQGQLRQIEARRQDGSPIVVELSVSTLRLSSGELRNVFIHDLTDELLTNAKLRQAQKMDAVGQLTGGIAHDFNNLLQGIIGSLDLIQLRLEQQQTANLGRFIDGAMTSAKRAAGLIHRLLAFSRRQPLDPKAVQANPRLASMEDLLRRTMGEQITLELVLAPDLWTTLCDPNQLESALLNLAINARDAMPEGGQLTVCSSNVEIDTSDTDATADERSQFICIEVADTGTGMDPDVVEHAFDPFFTTKPTGQGTGLGLSMVYGFARQSNGHCELHSKPGRGTCVRLYLPRLLEVAVTSEASVTQSIATQIEGSGETVLVVEDDPVVRSIVVEVLRELGYRALEAVDGTSGLDLLLSDAPIDLLVSDIGLPGLNGRQMADGARTRRPDLKVLLMTGYASTATEPAGFLAPGMELITKPFATPVLAERIQRMLRPS